MKRIELSFKRIDQSPSELSTKFQGFLMENLEPDYVTWLHEQETNPYSLKIIHQKDKTLWSLHLLTDEAVKQILPFLLELKKVELHDLPTLMVESLSMQDLSTEQLSFLMKTKIGHSTPFSFKLRQDFAPRESTCSFRPCVSSFRV